MWAVVRAGLCVVLLGAVALLALPGRAIVVPKPPYDCSEMQCNPGCSTPKMDFIFMIDLSTSVGPYVRAASEALGTMAQDIKDLGVLARFAFVGFQGYTELITDWTANATIVADALLQVAECIIAQGGIKGNGCGVDETNATSCIRNEDGNTITTCYANPHQVLTGQEALFDAVRRTLGKECQDCAVWRPNTDPAGWTDCNTVGAADPRCAPLPIRPDADVYVFAIADEDSDMPMDWYPYTNPTHHIEQPNGQNQCPSGNGGVQVQGSCDSSPNQFCCGSPVTGWSPVSGVASKQCVMDDGTGWLSPGDAGLSNNKCQKDSRRGARGGSGCIPTNGGCCNCFQSHEPPYGAACPYNVAPEWTTETRATADALLASNAEIAIFCRNQRASFEQYGNPQCSLTFSPPKGVQAHDCTTLENFDAAATLANILATGGDARYYKNNVKCHYRNSIQRMMLEDGGVARIFDIDNYLQTIPAYFNTIVNKYEGAISCPVDPCRTYSCSDQGGCITTLTCNSTAGCTSQCSIGGTCYEQGAVDPARPGQCSSSCQPKQSTSAWSPCDDGNACTQDLCTNDRCDFSQLVCPSLACGTCLIGGQCYNAGAGNPANGDERCDPAQNLTSWSAISATPGSACVPVSNCSSPRAKPCGDVPDGCGGTNYCGFCTQTVQSPNTRCLADTHTCGCVPDTCAGLGKTCGSAKDGCGGVLNCGSCDFINTGEVCIDNRFCANPQACQPTESCESRSDDCGVFTPADCAGESVSCGQCSAGSSCYDSGFGMKCRCVEETTCNATARNCGSLLNGCGFDNCGTCAAGDVCSPSNGGRCAPVAVITTTGNAGSGSGSGSGTPATTGTAFNGCADFSDCGSCAAHPSCGWCAASKVQACLPSPGSTQLASFTVCQIAGGIFYPNFCSNPNLNDECPASNCSDCSKIAGCAWCDGANFNGCVKDERVLEETCTGEQGTWWPAVPSQPSCPLPPTTGTTGAVTTATPATLAATTGANTASGPPSGTTEIATGTTGDTSELVSAAPGRVGADPAAGLLRACFAVVIFGLLSVLC